MKYYRNIHISVKQNVLYTIDAHNYENIKEKRKKYANLKLTINRTIFTRRV